MFGITIRIGTRFSNYKMPASFGTVVDAKSYRPQIAKLNRAELEDEFYRVFEENVGLKQKLNAQSDKMKQ